MTLVSVGIPTRNRAELLERSARSVLAQEGVALELVISDNASTDGTVALCNELAADPRVRVLRQETDIGAEANFRSVLEAARGSLFMWLADDDWLDPGYVSACAAVLEQHADHSLVCGRATYHRAGEPAFFVERPVNLQSHSAAIRLVDFYRLVTLNGTFYGVSRRDLLLLLPFRREVGSDWLLVAALAYAGKVRTIDGVSIHRSVEGASENQESLRRAYGLSKRQARHWYAVIARAVFRDIRSSSTYDGLGARRGAVAFKAAAFVVVRFGPKAIAANTLARLGLRR